MGLFSLPEWVQIEFWGNHETVEVVGSFTGWHHPIKIDPSTTIKPSGSRSLVVISSTFTKFRLMLLSYL